MKKLLLIVSIMIMTLNIWATDLPWSHKSLQSSDGTKITFDYQQAWNEFNGCYKCAQDQVAAPLWINLKSAELKESDRVRVVLLNSKLGNKNYSEADVVAVDTYEIDLVWDSAEGKFTAQLSDLVIFTSGYPGTWYYTQEIAVVINGQWLVDPINGSNNFSLKLY